MELEYVEDAAVEAAHQRQRVGALLAVAAEHEQGGVVFLAEKFERRGVFEGVDGVFLGEFDRQRPFQRVQVGEGQLDDFGAGAASQEEGSFGVFVDLGGSFLECAFRPGVARFAGGDWS